MKILLVEDDPRFSGIIKLVLSEEGYDVTIRTESSGCFLALKEQPYNLAILDILLPGLDGIALCRELRRKGYSLPILLLTARDRTSDQVSGLDAGADDYLLKPIKVAEFMARVRALLRRNQITDVSSLRWGELQLLVEKGEVTYQEKPLSLTAIEFRILEFFLRNHSRTIDCGDLIDNLWEVDSLPSENTVRSHIKKLRNKLKAVGEKNFLETLYGMGYRLGKPNVSPPPSDSTPIRSISGNQGSPLQPQTTTVSRSTPEQQKLVALLSQLRGNYIGSLLRDLRVLLEGMEVLSQRLTQDPQIAPLIKTAHNLSSLLGSLGNEQEAQQIKSFESALETLLNKQLQASLHDLYGDLEQEQKTVS
ncbi:MAG: response regulator transcription factor [Cyanobacteria bacterium P01_H01_bin.15]